MHRGEPNRVLQMIVQCTAFDAQLIPQDWKIWCMSYYFSHIDNHIHSLKIILLLWQNHRYPRNSDRQWYLHCSVERQKMKSRQQWRQKPPYHYHYKGLTDPHFCHSLCWDNLAETDLVRCQGDCVPRSHNHQGNDYQFNVSVSTLCGTLKMLALGLSYNMSDKKVKSRSTQEKQGGLVHA